MNKLAIPLNILLLILVGILFYLHFNDMKKIKENQNSLVKAVDSPIRLAYVNIDSLEQHYTYFQEKRAELDKKQQSIESELNTKANQIQNQIAKLQKDAPTLTQAQGEARQEQIINDRQKLQDREQQLREGFMQQQQDFNDTLHQRLNEFLEIYNRDKKYSFVFSYSGSMSELLYKDQAFDITDDVVKGLNDKR